MRAPYPIMGSPTGVGSCTRATPARSGRVTAPALTEEALDCREPRHRILKRRQVATLWNHLEARPRYPLRVLLAVLERYHPIVRTPKAQGLRRHAMQDAFESRVVKKRIPSDLRSRGEGVHDVDQHLVRQLD